MRTKRSSFYQGKLRRLDIGRGGVNGRSYALDVFTNMSQEYNTVVMGYSVLCIGKYLCLRK